MNRLQNIVAYLCHTYPYKHELSKARLTKLVYLADWFSSLLDDDQMTDVRWIFNHYGPYVDDIVDSVRNSRGFSISAQENPYGSTKYLVSYSGDYRKIELSERDEEILDAVIEKTKRMYFNDFIDYVYSTYPVKSSDRYAALDLVSLAREFRG
ncbi:MULTISPECIES: Panacea domain-containing protein [Pseudomonas]|uniref:Panacea domain-containing protein n=1 Tax=Pseudomonas TaxID=286 RepID=UPI001C65798C|nr:SocA family protein [Pseudomonas sp. LAP_36]MBW8135397.1 SocA family protein [Pseudomonas sp. PAMC 26818]